MKNKVHPDIRENKKSVKLVNWSTINMFAENDICYIFLVVVFVQGVF